MKTRHRNYRKIILTGALVLLGLLAVSLARPAYAQDVQPPPGQTPPQTSETESSDGYSSCLECHSRPGLQMVFPSGEALSLTVLPEDYAASVHGQHGTEGYKCIRCHTDKKDYPHEPVTAATLRDYTLEQYTACFVCHTDMYDDTLDGTHQAALADGNTNAAVCVDCHTAHTVKTIMDPDTFELLPAARLWVVDTCGTCHVEIAREYKASVHGAALVAGNNADVPVCTDCHGEHSITSFESPEDRLDSPAVCANCHTNEEMMAQYDLSTAVLDTYVADFHGSTVAFFERSDPNVAVPEPVCFDCHGAHDIQSADNPHSSTMQTNLLETCQQCHPDAEGSFTSAWMSHYEPSIETAPAVTIVNVFYAIVIPFTVGGMILVVGLDFRKRVSLARRQRKAAAQAESDASQTENSDSDGIDNPEE
jgi:uncharacterized CHY-type Zn-finger protein